MSKTFLITDIKQFRQKLLCYLRAEPVFCLLDSNDFYADKDLGQKPYYHSYDLVVGIGSKDIFGTNGAKAFDKLKSFHQKHTADWLMGFFSYDLKNELEKLSSTNPDGAGFPELYFFVPQTIITVKGKTVYIKAASNNEDELFASLDNMTVTNQLAEKQRVAFINRIAKPDYIKTVEKLRMHIEDGDVYEINFCQEFFAENAHINAFHTYDKLRTISPQPFGTFMRMDDNYILSASMERYLKKEGNKLISQPIKGTIRRGSTPQEEEMLKATLHGDEKERAENVMIVDLVRNDLSRSCQPGSVKVEELFGIYSFPGVFHMISTVTGELQDDKTAMDAIKNSFPMGSMTGAPKIMAMNLIEQYEQSKRGVYSGAIGYFSPGGDFDFNVVIRSLVYNESRKYLSLHVGSAITYDSDPEKEYEECLIKISRILKVFEE